MTPSAHSDTFARDNLPPRARWPELIFELPELQYPARMNCATELLDRMVARGHGGRSVIRTPDGQCSYAQLLAQANRLANVLVRDMGLQPGNRVLLRGPNNPMMAACWFAVMKAGGVCVATMPLLRAKELTDIVTKAQVSHALCDQRLDAELNAALPACPTLRSVSYWYDDAAGSLDALAARQPVTFSNVATAADDVALIAFTFGLGGLLCFPMRFGASVVLVERLAPESLLETVQSFGATVLFTAPTMFRAIAWLAPQFDLHRLKKCVSAGEALPDATRQLFKQATGIEIIDGIGATEMMHIFISHTPEKVRRGATGYAIPGYRATVLDDEGRQCKPGVIGRLAVKGPTGCRYLADDRQRQYVHDGWNLTGDAYAMDADGYFTYQARTDDMIISAGYNIAGPEVEGALLSHPAVAECGVVGVPDEERGMIVKAFVVLRAGFERQEELKRNLQDHVKRNIAPYKYPREIEFVALLPRTETGKLQRFKLRSEGGVAP